MRKTLIELLPVLTIALITIAFQYSYGYYSIININIYNYIDTTELLFGFAPLLSDFAVLINVLLLGIIAFISGYHTDNNDVSADAGNAIIIFIHKHRKIIYGGLYLVCLLSILYPAISSDSDSILYFILGGIIGFPCIFILSTILELPKPVLKKYSGLVFLFLFIMISGFFVAYGRYTGMMTISKNTTPFIILTSSRDTITSTKNLVLYGETKEYIFVYNKLDSITEVYKKELFYSIKYRAKQFPIPNQLRIKSKMNVDSMKIDSTDID